MYFSRVLAGSSTQWRAAEVRERRSVERTERTIVRQLSVDVSCDFGRVLKRGLEIRAGLGLGVIPGKADIGSVTNDVKDGVDKCAIGTFSEIMIPGGQIER